MSAADSAIILLVFFVLLALVVSFLCSVAETVLMSTTPGFIENLREQHPLRYRQLVSLRLDNIDRSLASILTMNTIAHTVGAIEAGAQSAVVFGSEWVGIFSAIMTLLILYFSEIIPKTLGAVYWQKLVPFTTLYVRVLIVGLYPLVWISEWVTKKIIGNKKVGGFAREEFVAMANLGREEGQLDERESKMIKALFQFKSLKVVDVMTPHTVIFALPETMSIAEAKSAWANVPFSRCPVYRESIDTISGFALKNEVLGNDAEQDKPLSSVAREILTVLDSTRLPDMLETLLEKRVHMALVVNEYGSLKGLVTLEDVLETLLDTEIMDEMDNVKDMQALARQRWKKRARALGLSLEEPSLEESRPPGSAGDPPA